MDNLPKDPPNENGNNSNTPASPIASQGGPPSFGANFNPHTNPIDPNNPYQSQPPQNTIPEPLNPPASPTQPASTLGGRGEPNSPNTPDYPNNDPEEIKHANYSEVAQSKPRDEHGRFIPDENQNPIPPPSNPVPSGTGLPPFTITENTKYSEKKDPPLFNFNASFTNPITYFKKWVERFLKNQDIDLRLKIKPFATIGLVLAFGVVGTTTFSIGRYLFPNSSPILHRQVVYPGVVQKGADGQYFLMSADSTLWKLKPKLNNIKLSDLVDKKVVITGNLTSERNLIEVSEVIVSETNTQALNPVPIPTSTPTPDIPDQDLLPKLYSNITWETNQKKILTFTSGKRRIEQEGVYLESAQVTNLPQEFINYYTNQLTNLGFKQTLNSTDPDGTMITYSKDELFLTFGIKNIYSGSGDSKKALPAGRQVTGYRAYIEHN